MTETDDTDDEQTDQSVDDGQGDRSAGTPPSDERMTESDESSDNAPTASEDKPLGSATGSVTNREGAANDGAIADSTAGSSPRSTGSGRDTDREDRYYDTGRSSRKYLELFALVGLGLLAAVTTYGFYMNANRAIAQLVAPTHESLFQAAFNLALLLLALAGLSLLARRRFDLP